ncbi:hypothetical protein SAMN05421739_11822 [Pontibacter chinhatensis]|uniref:Uncharacterized protein n=1 Tax=Pontibacter chinhatensis TaxID=1436961 RepID=A0A1I2ZSM7_9BACT|nr:hypothetical protein SAMN05421739_11822 [Pontibacter chinhatensis]
MYMRLCGTQDFIIELHSFGDNTRAIIYSLSLTRNYEFVNKKAISNTN